MNFFPTWKQIRFMLEGMTTLELELLQDYVNAEFNKRDL